MQYAERPQQKTNKNAQKDLLKESPAPQSLAPFFTTIGFEVEFAQQPTIGENTYPDNALNQAHIIVAKTDGFPLRPEIPFLLETDSGRALEFVTPPLLAPLEEGDEGKTVPDKAWEKKTRKTLEYSLRDIAAPKPVSVTKIIKKIKSKLGIDLHLQSNLPAPVPVENETAEELEARRGPNIPYGEITKMDALHNNFPELDSHTYSQLNYMTTLQNFMEINQAAEPPAPFDYYEPTNIFFTKAMEIKGNRLSPDADQYIYAICQKIREIPNILADQTLSFILRHDEEPDKPFIREGETHHFGDTPAAEIEEKLADEYDRKELWRPASKIKDYSILWLKASLKQILTAIPEAYYATIADIIQTLIRDKSFIRGSLPVSVKSTIWALSRYYEDEQIDEFIFAQLEKVDALLQSQPSSDYDNKPEHQKTVSEHREDITGARPDTYAPIDRDIADELLFLVETRQTSRYLGQGLEDRYKKKKFRHKFWDNR